MLTRSVQSATRLLCLVAASLASTACFDPAAPQKSLDANKPPGDADAAMVDARTPRPDAPPRAQCTPVIPTPVTVNNASLIYADGKALREIVLTAGGVVGNPASLPFETFNSDVKWLVYERSPTDDEKVIAAATADGLFVIPTSNDEVEKKKVDDTPAQSTRAFDLAFEQDSGHALLAYADGPSHAVYRHYDGEDWSDETSFPTETCASGDDIGNVLWVRLVPEPGTDRIAAGIAFRPTGGDNAKVCLVLWDDEEWKSSTLRGPLIDNMDTRRIDWPEFDMAWPGNGSLLAAWAIVDDKRRVAQYAQLFPGDDDVVVRSLESKNTLSFIDLAAAGDGCHVAGTFIDYGDYNERLYASLWTNNRFGEYPEVDMQIREFDSPDVDPNDDIEGTFDFPGATFWQDGKPIVVYSDDDNDLSFTAFESDQWQMMPLPEDVVIDQKTMPTESIRVAYVPGGSLAFAVMSDSDGNLFGASYSDGTWEVIDFWGLQTLQANVPTQSVAFDIAPIIE